MKFTKEEFTAFRADLKEAVKELEKKYQVDIIPQKISYNDYSFDIKLAVNKTDDGLDIEKEEFERYCSLYGLKPSDYKKQITISGKIFELYGFKTSAKKNCYKIRDISTGKQYLCDGRPIHATGTIKGPSHRCKYCGAWVSGNNPDELCDECKEVFGHSLYTEL